MKIQKTLNRDKTLVFRIQFFDLVCINPKKATLVLDHNLWNDVIAIFVSLINKQCRWCRI